jgi:hypothetical protein
MKGLTMPEPTELLNQPGAASTTPALTSEDRITITVLGEEKQFTLEELKKHAEKGLGADMRFREASELRNQAKAGLRTQELVKKLNSGAELNREEATELAEYTGAEPEDYMFNSNGATNMEPGVTPQPTATETQQPAVAAMHPDDKKVIEQARQDHYEKVVQKTKDEIQNTVDSDDVLGKIIAGKSADKQAGAKSKLFDMVFNEVSRRLVLGRQQYGPELIRESLQYVKSFVTEFGMPASTSGTPAREVRDDFPILGLGPVGGLSTSEIAAGKKLERVASGESGYAESFAQRLAERILKTRAK